MNEKIQYIIQNNERKIQRNEGYIKEQKELMMDILQDENNSISYVIYEIERINKIIADFYNKIKISEGVINNLKSLL